MKQAKGNGEYAKITLSLEPAERGSGIAFESKIKGGVVPKEYIPAVERGIRNAATSGPNGYPVVDFKATLIDGDFHAQDSSAYAFEIAGHRAARGGFEAAGTTLLEPIMDAEIRVPQEFVGGVLGDIARRRGKIIGISQDMNEQIISAEVPLAETFGWITELRGMTKGLGACNLQFSKYEKVPENIQEEMVNRWK